MLALDAQLVDAVFGGVCLALPKPNETVTDSEERYLVENETDNTYPWFRVRCFKAEQSSWC